MTSFHLAIPGHLKVSLGQCRPARGPTLREIVELVMGFQPITNSTISLSERHRREERHLLSSLTLLLEEI
jgi:hypothetical protein